jgi:hypothetical protein
LINRLFNSGFDNAKKEAETVVACAMAEGAPRCEWYVPATRAMEHILVTLAVSD